MVKNGVPVCYFEALAFVERIEVGFNVYYTFREGESAWIFAKVLRMLNQVLGVTSFSIDPYQLGYENPEGIDSGAFWFYRKLGFRPTGTANEHLLEREERKIAETPAYRSSPRTLRRLVTGNLLYEMKPSRDWDRFHVRNIGLAVQRRMRGHYRGDPDEARRRATGDGDDSRAEILALRRQLREPTPQRERLEAAIANDDPDEARRRATSRVARLLSIRIPSGRAFENLALVLDALPDFPRWTRAERSAVVEIVRAKDGDEEVRYLHLLQRHARLRKALIRLGSVAGTGPAGLHPRPNS